MAQPRPAPGERRCPSTPSAHEPCPHRTVLAEEDPSHTAPAAPAETAPPEGGETTAPTAGEEAAEHPPHCPERTSSSAQPATRPAGGPAPRGLLALQAWSTEAGAAGKGSSPHTPKTASVQPTDRPIFQSALHSARPLHTGQQGQGRDVLTQGQAPHRPRAHADRRGEGGRPTYCSKRRGLTPDQSPARPRREGSQGEEAGAGHKNRKLQLSN